jgi:hypothetical protein
MRGSCLDECHTTERAQVLHIRSVAMPSLVWGDVVEGLGGHSVLQVDGGGDCLSPEGCRHAPAFQQAASHSHHRLVTSLHNAILLWGIWCRVLPFDPMLGTVCLELMEVNSPLLSVRNKRSRRLVSTSTFALNIFTAASMSLLAASSATHMNLLQSSTRTRKNFLPPGVSDEIGPQKSPWTRSSSPSVRRFASDGNKLLFILVAMQSAYN